ncbi:GFA family protein [Marinivivus vitaminiproducens]|uniref:GFA family protein n=1 Tax=Marinivivus vitaminiproducens TaxID=3035935 RepID=UPI0027A681EE|nr:GFA family protein [Geminicoccaceae bacterium SCSIO 64248]
MSAQRETVNLEGGCLCGRVRYRIEGEITASAGWCHCRECRLAAGAPATVWIGVPRATLRMLRDEPAWYRSSSFAERGFCPSCGSALFFRSEREPEDVDVATACLDDPAWPSPGYHIWLSEAVPGLRIAPHLPGARRGGFTSGEAE